MTEEVPNRRKRKWQWSDLVVDHETGRLRESSVWSNIGKAAMTWGFVYVVWKGNSAEFLWLTYGGVVIGAEIGARILNQKQQVINEKAESK